MPVMDKATGRVVSVLVLLMVIGASLRGYLPGVDQPSEPGPPRSSASLAYVVALLGLSLLIVGAAVIARLRDPRAPAAAAAAPSERFGSGEGLVRWRVLVIAAGVLVGWLLAVWLLTRFIVPHHLAQPSSGTAPNAPPPDTAASPPPEVVDPDGSGDVVGYLAASTVMLVVLIVVGAVATAHRRRKLVPVGVADELPPPPAAAGASDSLVRAAQVGLAEIGDLSREPREAIIACYAAMEHELAHVPGAAPQDFDTPTEVLARAVEHRALHADNAARLVALFTEARFSAHVMSEQHRRTAVDVLALILAELRSAV
jgi:hypothetical protein